MRKCIVGVVAVFVGAGLAACSSDPGTESSAATPSTADVCTSVDALRGSLTALGQVRVVQDGTAALADAWTTVTEAWTRLSDDASAEYADEVAGVQAAADTVQSALDSAQAEPSAQALGDAAAAVGVFLQDAGALADEVESTC
jgi:hypothetical protein